MPTIYFFCFSLWQYPLKKISRNCIEKGFIPSIYRIWMPFYRWDQNLIQTVWKPWIIFPFLQCMMASTFIQWEDSRQISVSIIVMSHDLSQPIIIGYLGQIQTYIIQSERWATLWIWTLCRSVELEDLNVGGSTCHLSHTEDNIPSTRDPRRNVWL